MRIFVQSSLYCKHKFFTLTCKYLVCLLLQGHRKGGVRLDLRPGLLLRTWHQQCDSAGARGCGLPALSPHRSQKPKGDLGLYFHLMVTTWYCTRMQSQTCVRRQRLIKHLKKWIHTKRKILLSLTCLFFFFFFNTILKILINALQCEVLEVEYNLLLLLLYLTSSAGKSGLL